jgi:hypothetical protein
MFSTEQDVYDWLRDAEAELQHAIPEYRENREYYEHKQKPADVPADISYIVKNKILSHVNLQVSKVLGGKISKELSGDPQIVAAFSELLEDALEKNKFLEEILPIEENHRQVEGLGGIRVIFDTFEDSEYGLGMPRLYALDPLKGEILLDPNAKNGFHRDDKARAQKKRMLLSEAKKNPRWRKSMKSVGASASNFQESDHGQELKVDIYDIEFKKTFYFLSIYDHTSNSYFPIQELKTAQELQEESPDENFQRPFIGKVAFSEAGLDRARQMDDRRMHMDNEALLENLSDETVIIKKTVMFECKVANHDVMIEPPLETGYSDFTIIPIIHTVRSGDHKYPSSPVMYLRDTQDRINGVSSMMYLEGKRTVKNTHLIAGMSQKEFQVARRLKTDSGEYIFSSNAAARATSLKGNIISPALLQQHELDQQAFEQIGNTNAPDRGAPVDLSGKAIVTLQARADVPLYVSVTNLENGLTDVFRRLIEGFQNFMDKPFSITRKIEGVSKVLRYNSPLTADGDQEENFVSGDTVNPLQQMKTPSVKVDIITNTIQKEAEEANKAMALFGVQQLAPVDLHKAMFPKKWESTLQNSIEFNQAMQLVQAMQSLTPEGQALVAETIQNVAQQEAVLQQLEGNKQNGTL